MKSLIGATIAKKYLVRDVLGRGGNAVVYEALDLTMTRPVAIKVPTLDGDDEPDIVLRRFRREARTSAAVVHPNVCATYEVGQLDDGTPFLVTEWLDGESLAERLRREKCLSLEHAISIFSQLLSALSAAHARRIVHRDIKPANIFLSHVEGYDELVKVLDFGASKRLGGGQDPDGDDDADENLTAVGYVFGTPHYMAPEQIHAQPVDTRADLFACGAVLFEVLTGERLYRSRTPDEIFREIVSTPARTVRSVKPTLPIEIDEVVRAALRRKPDDRYPSAAAFRRALEKLAPLVRPGGGARLVSTQENERATRLTDLRRQFHELAGRHRAVRESIVEQQDIYHPDRSRPGEGNLPSIVDEDPDGTATTERRTVARTTSSKKKNKRKE